MGKASLDRKFAVRFREASQRECITSSTVQGLSRMVFVKLALTCQKFLRQPRRKGSCEDLELSFMLESESKERIGSLDLELPADIRTMIVDGAIVDAELVADLLTRLALCD
ncbi:hypothetical protein SAMN05444167_2293 [Terriglobus roseus]|uniref:Uncharacterized protein n=1 Tax=Terriglobus roseus TaxID=392734 RepID=A0A1G7KSL2_9BACT|nr:hypothetical protein SAMN05444167_2293 [Terriglobus roseus]